MATLVEEQPPLGSLPFAAFHCGSAGQQVHYAAGPWVLSAGQALVIEGIFPSEDEVRSERRCRGAFAACQRLIPLQSCGAAVRFRERPASQ